MLAVGLLTEPSYGSNGMIRKVSMCVFLLRSLWSTAILYYCCVHIGEHIISTSAGDWFLLSIVACINVNVVGNSTVTCGASSSRISDGI